LADTGAKHAGYLSLLGWQQVGRSVARTSYSISTPHASLTPLDDEIAQVRVYVSDTVEDDNLQDSCVAIEVFSAMVETISSCLGFQPTGELWGHEGVKWDLPNGGQVNLPAGLDA